MKEKDTFWVTKYALTSGIMEVQAEWDSDRPQMITWGERSAASIMQFAHGNDWHRLEVDAKNRAEQLRKKKIASLKKQLARLEAMKF